MELSLNTPKNTSNITLDDAVHMSNPDILARKSSNNSPQNINIHKSPNLDTNEGFRVVSNENRSSDKQSGIGLELLMNKNKTSSRPNSPFSGSNYSGSHHSGSHHSGSHHSDPSFPNNQHSNNRQDSRQDNYQSENSNYNSGYNSGNVSNDYETDTDSNLTSASNRSRNSENTFVSGYSEKSEGNQNNYDRPLSHEEVMEKKRELLYQFDRLEKRGFQLHKKFTTDSKLDEMQNE